MTIDAIETYITVLKYMGAPNYVSARGCGGDTALLSTYVGICLA